MPGSPPISTSEPGTTPPPSTRSSSPMPRRDPLPAVVTAMSPMGMGRAPAASSGRAEPRRGRGPLLHQRHVGPDPRAVRAGAGLRRGEAAVLAAIGRSARAPSAASAPARCLAGRRRGPSRWSSGSASAGGSSAARPRGTDEVLVHGRVLEQRAHRALARLEPVGDRAQVGHRGAEVGGPVAGEPSVPSVPPSWSSSPSRPWPCAPALGDVAEVVGQRPGGPRRPVLYCGIEEQRGEQAVAPAPASRRPGRARPSRRAARGPTCRCPARAARPPRVALLGPGEELLGRGQDRVEASSASGSS